MPHATSAQDEEDAEDDILIQQALHPESGLDLIDRDLDPGEKAEDARNYEDISDDDLPEDEALVPGVINASLSPDAFAQTTWNGCRGSSHSRVAEDEVDDLFGDDAFDVSERNPESLGPQHDTQPPPMSQIPSRLTGAGSLGPTKARAKDPPLPKEQQLQQELFALSQHGPSAANSLPEPPANGEELLAALWPRFERGTVPMFMDLLPPKKARYGQKEASRLPRPLNPSRISLEIAQDQEKAYKLTLGTSIQNRQGVEKVQAVSIQLDQSADSSSDGESFYESDYHNDEIHGVSWLDLQILCENWNIASDANLSHSYHTPDGISADNVWSYGEDLGISDIDDIEQSAAKRRKLTQDYYNLSHNTPIDLNYMHDFELATARIAKTIKLDLNDTDLLVDEGHTTNECLPIVSGRGDDYASGGRRFDHVSGNRYNISNDEAYDLLKENHQHKIRSMLGSLHVEHSLPALRLQWPFYKTRLEKHEARSFHRPPLKVNRHEQVSFDKPAILKRKHTRGKDPHTLFARTRDLALDDNSNILLLEYSEEYPMMLSNLGMGNKVVNYYRKKTSEDTARPKMDIGELNVLLPQDKSPFSLFGHVDSGQVTPAIHNGLYRAPIFRQEPKGTDFLVIKTSTGVHGSAWYLRNIDHLHIVGQEFPAVDVPGPHSRKVTTASKNRLRMISYRMARRTKSHRISVSEVTRHFVETTDMQNRQKMKEFMQFDKDHKEWKMRQGESIPEEENVRTMVKPEDVCLLESMQVGQQHLQDAGFSKDDEEQSEGDDMKEGENIEQQLAPWFTSRNFLNAAQGKAMLQVHGEGDPSGRGEAFSFIKTSMKGGFRAIGESVAERISNKNAKDSTGHTYNVARQQQSYEESIRRVWEAQKQSLSSALEHSDSDVEDENIAEPSDSYAGIATPRSEGQGSGQRRHRDDETASQSTRWSTNSQSGKILEITRTVRNRYGGEEVIRDVIRNPRVIRQYLRRRRAQEAAREDVLDIKPGNDDEENKRKEQRLKRELARLERNKDRRIARDKQKGIHTDGATDVEESPVSPGAAPAKPTGTQRKCANCGKVGHIKTNKKLCPMLNGTMKLEEGFSTSAFTTGAPAL